MASPVTTTDASTDAAIVKAKSWIEFAVFIGAILAVTGIVVGIVMGVHRRQIDCPNGTEFPEGETDFRCFSHPHIAEGIAVGIVSAMLGVLIVMLAWVAFATAEAKRVPPSLSGE